MIFKLDNVKEEFLNYEKLVKEISPYDIYSYYLGNINVGKITNSPFRKDESPSFGIFIKSNGTLAFNDYLLGGGNCVKFVEMMENCDWRDAYHILNHRYNLGYITFPSNNLIPLTRKKEVVITNRRNFEKEEIWISIKLRSWSLEDKNYWGDKYEIKLETLKKFNVFPISKFWINYKCFHSDRLSYAYRFDKNVYKIYQPNRKTENFKWVSNIKDKNIYQGEKQLPVSGDILFITSSLKDVMVLYEAGYSAIAPHTEHQILSEDKYQELSKRFNRIVVFYDNDNAGKVHAQKMVDLFNIDSIYVPEEKDIKDPSDYVEKYNLKKLKKWIKYQI